MEAVIVVEQTQLHALGILSHTGNRLRECDMEDDESCGYAITILCLCVLYCGIIVVTYLCCFLVLFHFHVNFFR